MSREGLGESLGDKNQTLLKALAEMGGRLEASLRMLSAIANLSSVPVEAESLADAANKIVTILVRDLPEITNCSILLFDPEKNELRLLAAMGQADLVGDSPRGYNKELTFKPGEGVAGKVYLEDSPIFESRAGKGKSRLKMDPSLTTPKALACLPLTSADRRMGVLNASYDGEEPFDLPRRRELILVSGVVANIINAYLLKSEVDLYASSLEQSVKRFQQELKERERTEKELRASEDRYRVTFESIPDSLTISRLRDQRLVKVNQGFCRLFGFTPEEVLGKSVSALNLFPDSKIQEEVYQALAQGRLVSDREVTFRKKDGRRLETLFTAKPFRYGGEECVLAIAKDITDLKRSEEEKDRLKDQLRQSQKMEAVGTLASGVAHDFNNILQAVSGYVQLLSASEAVPPFCAPYLTGIDESVARASELVRRMLTFSRKMEPALRPLDLNQEVDRAVKVLERVLPKMVTIKTRLSSRRLVINGDPQQLEQALLNLGTNARDAMPQGGTLTIETEPFHLAEDDARTHLELGPGDYARLKVSDTGAGMDEVTLQQIFDPFFTTKEVGKGTGLGLSMVYGIVEGHRGSLSCQSTPGKGTVFSLSFPALDPDLETLVAEPEPIQILPQGGESILLVDDEKVILEIGRELLSTFGFNTLTATSGEEALEVYRRGKGKIDLVILDLNMPGMGGETCLREILEFDPRAKIIIASGYSADTKAEESLAGGARGFVPKPYRLRDLAKAVRSVLDED